MSQRLKTSATKLLVLSAAFSAQPCSSDYVFGYSDNAASGGSSWGMSSSLFSVPTIQGVDVTGVIYQYTAVKDRPDPYTVSIQNEAADGNGFIFRETDDWSGKSGGTITKFVPVPYSPLGEWGTGHIEQVGIGSVVDPTVVYTFRQDPIAVQPELPELLTYDLYDALSDSAVLNALAPTDLSLIEDDELEKDKDEEKDDGRLEKALAASENALTIANGMTQSAILKSMNIATNLNGYYVKEMTGGVYKETVVLQDKNIPDNRRAFRNLAQQVLHKQMVDQQYGR
jgi:hypothetical protein